MAQHVICRSCRSAVTIADDSPVTIACPHCGALIRNPHPFATSTAQEPLPVGPLEYRTPQPQGRVGRATALRNIGIVGVALVLGGLFELVTLPDAFGGVLIVIGLVLTIVAFGAQKWAQREATRDAGAEPAVSLMSSPSSLSSGNAALAIVILISLGAIVATIVLSLLAWSLPYRWAGTPQTGRMTLAAIAISGLGAALVAYVAWRLLRRVGAARTPAPISATANERSAAAGQFIIGILLAGGMTFVLIIFELIYGQMHGFHLSVLQKIGGWTIVVAALTALVAWCAWRARIAGERGYLAGALAGIGLGGLLVGFCGGMFGMVA
jgi:hypothetical protein